MTEIKLKRTTEREYEMYERLLANKDRVELRAHETRPIENSPVGATKTLSTLSFYAGVYFNSVEDEETNPAISNGDQLLNFFQTEKKEIATIHTIESKGKKLIEIRWSHGFSEDTYKAWDEAFGLDSEIKRRERPKKEVTAWEKKGLSKNEYFTKRAQSRLEDLQIEYPTEFGKLMDLVESGGLNKLIKLAESL